jgi:glycosyltransferase involved in cell wall biosynthesis
VTDELRGSRPVGGIGTGVTFLALGLARMGHDVEILDVRTPAAAVDLEWSAVYRNAGIRIRSVDGLDELVEPRYFSGMRETERALRADPPDVVITQDTAAPAYIALRLRQLGLGFENTLFVVVCYGTRLWMKDVARTVRVFPYLLGLSALEGASVELADVVVSPSKYVVDWMQQQGWRLPGKTLVIPYLSRSAATGDRPAPKTLSGDRVERIAFFGRLEERKGLKPFVAGLNALDPQLLQNVELEFIGAPTAAWPPERITGLLSDTTTASLRRITFETDLDQPAALERLARPGTLAVMPSLGETFGNVTYECLEHGIPFIASDAGATPELIAPEDHPRVLFEPTPQGVEAALRRALSNGEALRPARPAFDPDSAYERWVEVVSGAPAPAARRPPTSKRPRVDVIVVDSERRSAAFEAGSAPFVVFLDEHDEAAENFVELLLDAQAASRADVVTCGLRLRDPPRQHLFIGNPGALGLLSNTFGTPALIRRSLLTDVATPWPMEHDTDWPRLAQLHLAGARIVSIPVPLVTRTAAPGSLDRNPSDALLVSALYEQALPAELRPLGRIAAGLASAAADPSAPAASGLLQRLRARFRR